MIDLYMKTHLILGGLAASSLFVAAEERPNVIVFLVDDMGWIPLAHS